MLFEANAQFLAWTQKQKKAILYWKNSFLGDYKYSNKVKERDPNLST